MLLTTSQRIARARKPGATAPLTVVSAGPVWGDVFEALQWMSDRTRERRRPMKPSDEQMRDTAYEIIRQLRREREDCDAEPDDDYVANVIVGVLREAFPGPPAVEGSVLVRVAVALAPGYRKAAVSWEGAIPGCGADEAMNLVITKHDTHRAIVEVPLPPVAQVPVVQGTVVKDQP